MSVRQGNNLPDSTQPNATGLGKKTRPRRTKKEMIAYRAEQVQLKKMKAQEKAKQKRLRSRGVGQARRTTGQRSLANSSTPGINPGSTQMASQPLDSDSNPQFGSEDYENVCGYLEEEVNYTRLYGDGSKTSVGTTKVTKAAAYEMFAIFINDNSNRRLNLTGSQLRQRIDGYKKRFMKAKEWAENTGAGIEEGDNLPTLAEILEKKCPCYDRMYGIFGGKANVTPLAQFDSGVGADLYMTADDTDNPQDPASSPEVFFPGWDETQEEPPPLGLTTPAEQQESPRGPGLHEGAADLSLPTLDGDLSLPDDILPPPLEFSGTPLTPSPGLNSPRSLAGVNGRSSGAAFGHPNGQTTTPDSPHPVQPGRRAFPNQRSTDASPAGPARGVNPQARSTLASAFENSNSEKFVYLKEHMEWEKQKEEKRLTWEKERYNKEAALAKDGRQGQLRLAESKMKAAREWISQGKTAAEVEGLLKAVYG
ncbi:hypothetical protein PGTUg99_037081 [Puccinia graminis f. sp. tritici]|uniref:Uncharacterized protein n=1 Tax=Puccinia graminis f. sp. tritici TaxID=56615 RepID=A0A5B0PQE1_PUCGR|nr:hypothetical protein PGTUg99_037081 [Puccinia graminis f. sp. tritici]